MTFSDVFLRLWLPFFICWIKKFLAFCDWHNEMVIRLYVVQFWDNRARNFKWVLHYTLGLFEITCPTDLLRLSILFSQYRSCDDTQESIFFQSWRFWGSHSLFNEHDKGSNLLGIVWSSYDLYWENKIDKWKRSISIGNHRTSSTIRD